MVANPGATRDMPVMAKGASLSKTEPKKRGQGRPVSGENDVGRERLLVATEKLLRTMPPARVTIARIAQEAKVDPALVRYYFGSRSALLVALVDRVTTHAQRGWQPQDDPVTALADHIGKTVQFVRSAPYMHRLMIDELMQEGTQESRARVTTMNQDLVAFYKDLLGADDGRELVATDPLFLHLAVLGASDFFSSAEPLVRALLPEEADMEKLTSDFRDYLIALFMDGLRKR
ncbi:TetR/AcrR family transcriptional regulator [Sphingomonas sp. GB1N7]